MDLADPDDDSFDQQQLKLATERSLHTASKCCRPCCTNTPSCCSCLVVGVVHEHRMPQ